MSKILYEKKGGIAYITCNRPEVKNAIDLGMHNLLHTIWADFRDDEAEKMRVIPLFGSFHRTNQPEILTQAGKKG